jgi:hypothetical protein
MSKENDATKEGVSATTVDAEENKAPAVPIGGVDRLAALREISDSRNKEEYNLDPPPWDEIDSSQKSAQAAVDDDVVPGKELEQKESESGDEELALDDENEDGQQKAAPDPLSDLGYYYDDSGTLVRQMKINGVLQVVRADQVTAHLQKDIAGDQKLQLAAERESSLDERERRIADRESRLDQTLKHPPVMGDDEVRGKAKETLQQLYDGNEEEAVEGLVELIQRGNATVDESQLIEHATTTVLSAVEKRDREKADADWRKSVDAGNRALFKDHPEIWESDSLFQEVNDKTGELVTRMHNGDPELVHKTPADLIAMAAQEVQDGMDSKGGKKRGSGKDQRKANKDGLTRMPTGNQATRKVVKEEGPDMSTAAVIERMAKSRAGSAQFSH